MRDAAYTLRRGTQSWSQRTIMGELSPKEEVNGVGPIYCWHYRLATVSDLKRNDRFVQLTETTDEGGPLFAVIDRPVTWRPTDAVFSYGQIVAGVAFEMIRAAYDADEMTGLEYTLRKALSYHRARMTFPAVIHAFCRVLDLPAEIADRTTAMYSQGIPADLMWWGQPEKVAAKSYRRLGRVGRGELPTFALSVCHDWLTDVMMSKEAIDWKIAHGLM